MNLSPSDLIAIIVGAAQILVTVGVAVWQIRRSSPVVPGAARAKSSTFRAMLRGTWFMWLFAIYGIYQLVSIVLEPEPITRATAFEIAWWLFYVIFNLIGVLGYFLLHLLSQLAGVLKKSVQAQSDMLGVQKQALAITREALTTRSTERAPGSSDKVAGHDDRQDKVPPPTA